MQAAFRLSRQQYAYADVLWHDMLASYGDNDSPDYWRQRMQRRAYQGAVLAHLLKSAHSLSTAILKQLADTRFVDVSKLELSEVSPLLQQQPFLSAPAQLLLQAMQTGQIQQMLDAQQVFNGGVVSTRMPGSEGDLGKAIGLVANDNLDDPDRWPVGQWLRDLKELQDTTQAELLEY